ncbi:MAG: hypothetical protein BWY66_01018 [bacterium ADurb.Bin374]|nr:MAG: hypothetical protein BWY66_01018 [bacterium ADurb.Bin374]
MVDADAPDQLLAELVRAFEGPERVFLDGRIDHVSDPFFLGLAREVELAGGLPCHLVGKGAGEDEIQDGKAVLGLEGPDDVEMSELGLVLAALPALRLVGLAVLPDTLVQLLERQKRFFIVKSIRKRNRPLVVGDDRDLVVEHRFDPVCELRVVGNRRRQGQEPDRLRREDDRFLPDGAALDVAEIMYLIEYDVCHVGDRGGVLDGHVPIDLGGHDEGLGVAVDDDVAGEDADLVAVQPRKVAVFLVRERLDGRRVDDAPVGLENLLDEILGDEGLAGAGRRRKHERVAVFDLGDGLDLEIVEDVAAVGDVQIHSYSDDAAFVSVLYLMICPVRVRLTIRCSFGLHSSVSTIASPARMAVELARS